LLRYIDAAKHAFWHEYLRCHLVRAEKPEALLLDNPAYTRQQMIVAAAVRSHDARQHHQCQEIRAKIPQGRPHQRPDKNHVAATCRVRQPCKGAKLAHTKPVMRIARNQCRVSVAAKRE
jgi:hypothetical protein